MSLDEDEETFLDKLGPAPLKAFDAFPKVPDTYQSRSDSRGFLTVLIALMCFALILNDIGEFIWGWPEYQFTVDREVSSYLRINLDMIVNMPCRYISVDLRDSVGDRLFLNDQFTRDGTSFDVEQARKLQIHSWKETTSQRKVIPQTRKNQGFFGTLSRKTKKALKPIYMHTPEDTACRIHGNTIVKKVTANLHITVLGHGYASQMHVPHEHMNLSHIIQDFSFGPYFPDIVQPLENTFAMTYQHFTAYQYFLTVVPTKYIPARAGRYGTVHTNQYSVTNYVKQLNHGQGTPGIFFKFDMDPVALTIEEKTTTFVQLLIRCVGVVGGIWVCMGWAVRVSFKAVEVVTGVKEGEQEIVEVVTSGAKKRWGGSELKRRVVKQGNGWIVEGSNDFGSGTPQSATFTNPNAPYGGGYFSGNTTPQYASTPNYASTIPLPGSPGVGSAYFPSPRPSQSTFSNTASPSGLGGNATLHESSPNMGGGGLLPPVAGHGAPPQGPPGRRDSRGNSLPRMSEQERAFKDR